MAKEKELKFAKEQWAASNKYKDQPDLIEALLADGESYTEKQVEKIMADYLRKEIK